MACVAKNGFRFVFADSHEVAISISAQIFKFRFHLVGFPKEPVFQVGVIWQKPGDSIFETLLTLNC